MSIVSPVVCYKYTVYRYESHGELSVMQYISVMFYLLLFYICIILFIWNFDTFTFQEKIIVGILISGFQCVSFVSNLKHKE